MGDFMPVPKGTHLTASATTVRLNRDGRFRLPAPMQVLFPSRSAHVLIDTADHRVALCPADGHTTAVYLMQPDGLFALHRAFSLAGMLPESAISIDVAVDGDRVILSLPKGN